MKIVVGITGASGAALGIKLVEELRAHTVYLIISSTAKKIIESETNYSVKDIIHSANYYYDNSEMDADIASGTQKFDAMVVIPCSTNTLAKIANGIADNLITRVASIALKEKRKLVIVPRETPLSTVALRNMYELSMLGAHILPPVPAFYLKPKGIEDVIDYIVGKTLDYLGIEHSLYTPYRR